MPLPNPIDGLPLTDETGTAVPLLVVGVVLLLVVALLGSWRRRRLRYRGFAGYRDIRRALSPRARRAGLAVVRPSLTTADRPAEPACGIRLGRAHHTRQELWASFEDVVGLVAPPRMGKTGLLAGTVADAPGAVLVTSTRADIYTLTVAQRAARGPLHVFNPDGLGGLPSSFRWSPITGCDDPGVAGRRAGALLQAAPAAGGTQDPNFWEGAAYRVLRSYLYAAAVSGAGMARLNAWACTPYDRRPLEVLTVAPATPYGWATELKQLLDAPDRTLQSVFLTLSLSLEFMSDAAAAAAVTPVAGEPVFDVDGFVAGSGTLYLLGADRARGSLAPLIAALTSEVYERAIARASRLAHGRLDPPLVMALDEAATVCPVPLDRWSSVSGGWGITLAYAVQSPSQLYDRWGRLPGQTIWNNTTARVILGGLGNAEYLDELAKLCGERDEPAVTVSDDGWQRTGTSTSPRRGPVLGPGAIRQLEQWQALVLYRNLAPIRARVTPVWRR